MKTLPNFCASSLSSVFTLLPHSHDCLAYSHRQWDKVKAGEVSNLVWGLAQLGAPPHPALLHNVVSLAETECQVGMRRLSIVQTGGHVKHSLIKFLH